jgi:hypothetical protein
MNDVENICKCFEEDLILFIERELEKEKFEEYNLHLRKCNTCSKLFADSVTILNSGRQSNPDISGDKFEMMISKAVASRKSYSAANTLFSNRKEKITFYWKTAFAAVLVFASITIFMMSHKSNPVKIVSREILDWEGAKIENDINDIGKKIDLLSNESWNKKVNQIDKSLKELEKQTDKYSFN